MIKVLVSACLLGERVRYDGSDARSGDAILEGWLREGRVVPFCPEVAGGFPVPRLPAEIQGGDGAAVLDAAAPVLDVHGRDVTAEFLLGARRALAAARDAGARLAILKDGSPSCGSGFVYDGSFSGQRRDGSGVTTTLLEREGIRVFNERQLDQAARHLAALEAGTPYGRGAGPGT